MESTRPIWASSSTPAILAGAVARLARQHGTLASPASAGRYWRARRRQVSYSSGTRVAVALVRVSFRKNAGAVSRM